MWFQGSTAEINRILQTKFLGSLSFDKRSFMDGFS